LAFDVAIGVAVVRRSVLEGLKRKAQLTRSDVELITRPFKQTRDVTISVPKARAPTRAPRPRVAARALGGCTFSLSRDPLDPIRAFDLYCTFSIPFILSAHPPVGASLFSAKSVLC